jgi:hypothetical protein
MNRSHAATPFVATTTTFVLRLHITAAICIFLVSCGTEGPLGLRKGDQVLKGHYQVVVEVGKDWVQLMDGTVLNTEDLSGMKVRKKE